MTTQQSAPCNKPDTEARATVLRSYQKSAIFDSPAPDEPPSDAKDTQDTTPTKPVSNKAPKGKGVYRPIVTKELEDRMRQALGAGACSPGHGANKCNICLNHEALLEARARRQALEEEVRKLRLEQNNRNLASKFKLDELANETEQLRSKLANRNRKIAELRREIENLSLEPRVREIQQSKSDNEFLSQISGANLRDFENLKEKYKELESRLKQAVGQQSHRGNELLEQESRLTTEFYNLQVQQKKLEQLLETEQQIKIELQSRIKNLLDQNAQLKSRVSQQTGQLNLKREICQNKSEDELNRLNDVIVKLKQENSSLEEQKLSRERILRVAQNKCDQLEQRLRRAKESGDGGSGGERSELADARRAIETLEQEKQRLLERTREQSLLLDSAERERQGLIENICNLSRKLELSSSDLDQVKTGRKRREEEKGKEEEDRVNNESAETVKRLESTIVELQGELQTRCLDVQRLRSNVSELNGRLAEAQVQYDELKKRYDLQSDTISAINLSKDKEVAKLRVDLNYERYNRQVAVRGVERELRASLKELEIMKCRFLASDHHQRPTTHNKLAPVLINLSQNCDNPLNLSAKPTMEK